MTSKIIYIYMAIQIEKNNDLWFGHKKCSSVNLALWHHGHCNNGNNGKNICTNNYYLSIIAITIINLTAINIFLLVFHASALLLLYV